MSTTKKANSLPVASSTSGISILGTDTSGVLQRVSARNIVNEAMSVGGTYVLDLNEATEPGVFLLSGTTDVLNGPSGFSTVVGILEVFKRVGTETIFQRIMNRFGGLATRAKFNGNWSGWKVLS